VGDLVKPRRTGRSAPVTRRAPPPALADRTRAAAGALPATTIERLKSQVAALEHLLMMQERAVLEQSGRLARAAEETRRRAEDLEGSERVLQSILDSMSDGVAVADAGGRLRLFNNAAARMLGLGPVDAPPGDWPARYGFHEADGVTPFPSDRLPLVRAIRGEQVDDQEVYVDREGGPSGLWLRISSRPIRDAGGRVTGGVSVLRDVTRRVEAERALARRTAELQRSNAELEQFAYVASHDLQEPLRVVRSYADLLARRCRGRLDADADRFLETILGHADRMIVLVGDLLALSRVGTSTAEPEPCDAGLQCDRAVAGLRDLIAREGATVGRGPLPRVRAVPGQLSQVFQNLISNGIKFHGERPARVHVSGEVQGGVAHLAVRDDGIGIPADGLEAMFAMFTRLGPRDDAAGSGIGLAICRRIVERHGGRIWAESEPGRGATLRFTLPAADEGDA
jgi:signal transduction histidine kinase